MYKINHELKQVVVSVNAGSMTLIKAQRIADGLGYTLTFTLERV